MHNSPPPPPPFPPPLASGTKQAGVVQTLSFTTPRTGLFWVKFCSQQDWAADKVMVWNAVQKVQYVQHSPPPSPQVVYVKKQEQAPPPPPPQVVYKVYSPPPPVQSPPPPPLASSTTSAASGTTSSTALPPALPPTPFILGELNVPLDPSLSRYSGMGYFHTDGTHWPMHCMAC